MAKSTAVSGKFTLRLDPALLKRAEALRPKVARDPSIAGLGRVTQTTVVKLALIRGLDALEAEYK